MDVSDNGGVVKGQALIFNRQGTPKRGRFGFNNGYRFSGNFTEAVMEEGVQSFTVKCICVDDEKDIWVPKASGVGNVDPAHRNASGYAGVSVVSGNDGKSPELKLKLTGVGAVNHTFNVTENSSINWGANFAGAGAGVSFGGSTSTSVSTSINHGVKISKSLEFRWTCGVLAKPNKP